MKAIRRRNFEIEIGIKNTQGEKRKTSKHQEREHTREYADFRRFQREGVLSRDQYIYSVRLPCTTNPTNYNTWLRIHTLVE